MMEWPRRSCVRFAFALALPAAAAACSGDARFTTRFASDFVPDRHVVSVLGVYRDGRMSSEAWGAIGPRISASLGAPSCSIAYAEPLVSSNGPLWSAIDDYARANGPTDDLLVQLAPAATGDLILVLTLAGKVPVRQSGASGEEPSASLGGSGRGGGGMGRRSAGGGLPAAGRQEAADTNALDLSASLFSVARGRSVALVSMEYSGTSAAEAIALFSAKLAQEMHGTTCGGWTWDAKVDAGRIRQMIDP
jgi:hypothetical protein